MNTKKHKITEKTQIIILYKRCVTLEKILPLVFIFLEVDLLKILCPFTDCSFVYFNIEPTEPHLNIHYRRVLLSISWANLQPQKTRLKFKSFEYRGKMLSCVLFCEISKENNVLSSCIWSMKHLSTCRIHWKTHKCFLKGRAGDAAQRWTLCRPYIELRVEVPAPHKHLTAFIFCRRIRRAKVGCCKNCAPADSAA